MSPEKMLQMLKVDLGISTSVYDERLSQYITTAETAIRTEGIDLDLSAICDANLVLIYAAWLRKKRDTGEGIPRNLRWMMNNRLFSQKIGGGDA